MSLSAEQQTMHMRKTLLEAAVQFKCYASQHAAKQTPEGDQKAQTNDLWAAKCQNAADIT